MPTDLRTIALNYHRRGLPVIPIKPGVADTYETMIRLGDATLRSRDRRENCGE